MSPGSAEEAARVLWEEGQRAWPGVEVEEAEFRRYLAVRPAARASGADLYLACACAAGQGAALAAFEAHYLSQVPAMVSRLSLSADRIDEVQQRVRTKLLVAGPQEPRILHYGGQGALGSWVRVVALREAHTLLRQRGEGRLPEDDLAGAGVLGGALDPELDYVRQRYQGDFKQALRDAIVSLGSEERNLLRLCFVDGLSIDQLGGIFGVHRATAARKVQRVREQVFEHTRQLLRERLGVQHGELDSLIRVLRSQLNVSLRALLSDQ